MMMSNETIVLSNFLENQATQVRLSKDLFCMKCIYKVKSTKFNSSLIYCRLICRILSALSFLRIH